VSNSMRLNEKGEWLKSPRAPTLHATRKSVEMVLKRPALMTIRKISPHHRFALPGCGWLSSEEKYTGPNPPSQTFCI